MSDVLDVPESDLVFLHSPLSMLAMFTRFFQIQFSQGRFPWQWDEDPNKVWGDGTDLDAKANIYIEAEFALAKEYESAAPAVIVTRGAVVHPRPVIGDQGPVSPNQLTRGWKNEYGHGEMDVRLQCIGQTKAEAAIIGDIVQAAVTMTRGPIMQAMTLRDISATVLNPTMPYIRDKDKWQNNVDFRVKFEQRWLILPVAPVLDRADFYAKNTLDAVTYVKTFALKNQ
jgi:hypothetical protein